MKNVIKSLTLASALVMATSVSMSSVMAHDDHAFLQHALENSARLEAHKARDGDRKPMEVLDFVGIKPGMTVLDLYASGGYYSMIMAGAVGDKGKVIAQNTKAAGERNGEHFAKDYAGFKNIDLLYSDPADTGLADNSVDMASFVLMYHHFNYDENMPDGTPERTAKMYQEVLRVLKPGGTFMVIEHEAPRGTSRQQSAEWHRATAASSIEDAQSVGFEFAGDAPIHVNPDDPMNVHWGPAGLRGKTTRFVHKFVKPK